MYNSLNIVFRFTPEIDLCHQQLIQLYIKAPAWEFSQVFWPLITHFYVNFILPKNNSSLDYVCKVKSFIIQVTQRNIHLPVSCINISMYPSCHMKVITVENKHQLYKSFFVADLGYILQIEIQVTKLFRRLSY